MSSSLRPASSIGSADGTKPESGSSSLAKRPAALNGISSTVDDKNVDFLCPICFDLIIEAHITRCGHTFCYQCINYSIDSCKRCPKCNAPLTSSDQIFPNYLLGELIAKYKVKVQLQEHIGKAGSHSASDGLKQFLTNESEKLTLPDVNVMLDILTQRKERLESESNTAQNKLLFEFLKHLLRQKEEQKAQITKEIKLVRGDLSEVQQLLKTEHSDDIPMNQEIAQMLDSMETKNALSSEDGFNSLICESMSANFVSRKRRMHAHFEDFVKSYFSVRTRELYVATTDDQQPPTHQDDGAAKAVANPGLDEFRDNLVKFSKYNTLRPLATMHYSNDLHNNSTIVSTIVFDKDNEYFAIGGVTKRIKIFDYLAVIRDTVDIHYPVVEMISNSKISCITWNSYHKNILASSDYEGAVSIWDVQTGSRTKTFHEHEKRCWSVDFNDVSCHLIASGSDDARVKLWSINEENSIATLEAKANVCCVKFNPKSSCHLAFGSADHDVHYYDLRNMNKALCIFKGHRKAVSYVKFLNTEEIISASTDSQLKLWNVNKPPYSLRSFVGHVNEKNFVGLATDGDYVACGSEDNSLYIYYKGLSKQLFNYKIDGDKLTDSERSNDLNEFVSAVCWRKNCNVVLAANSRGLIKVLELV
ncbi:E3 ubiquitin-protein ligase COP1-like isoform X1 [Bradysia coprophila]|uniref:E3 ubiquitin-protein ligase COP1-like isoform X1 n=1 Tax=Bradysia coprophila TaxID=38358 RepID=UPI00187D8D43|nr:E3 ubiquitin-protein ligase COP1-like isoform X1 [Bradysia coprophila]